VHFAKSGRTLTWKPDEPPMTLLGFAEQAGLALPSGCRVGQCESCAVRIVSGRVAHLSGSEPEDPAMCLACQAVPLGDIVLDI
jgi:ferredoxin